MILDPNLSDQQLYTIASDTQHLSDEILLELRFHPNAYPSLTHWALEMLSLPPGHEGFPPPEPGEDLDEDFYAADASHSGGRQGRFFSRILAALPFGGGRSRDKTHQRGRGTEGRTPDDRRRSDWMREYGPGSGTRSDDAGALSVQDNRDSGDAFTADAWDSASAWADPPGRHGIPGRKRESEAHGVTPWDEVLGQEGPTLQQGPTHRDDAHGRDLCAVGGRDSTYDAGNRPDEGSISLGFSSGARLRDDTLDDSVNGENADVDSFGEGGDAGRERYAAGPGDADNDVDVNSGYAPSSSLDPLPTESTSLSARSETHAWAHDDDDWDSADEAESDEADADQRDWFGTHQIREVEQRRTTSHIPALGSHDSYSTPRRHDTTDSEYSSLPLRRERPHHGERQRQYEQASYARQGGTGRNTRRRQGREDTAAFSPFSHVSLPARIGMIGGILLIVAMGAVTVYLRFFSPGLASAANSVPAADQPAPAAQSGQSEAQQATDTTLAGTPAQSGSAQPGVASGAPSTPKHLRAGQSSYECGSQGVGVTCWGYFGDNDYREPQEIQGLQQRAIVKLAVGRNFGVAVDDGNTVWAWGINDRGQMGRTEGSPDVTTAVEIGALPATPSQIIAAHDHTCLLVEGKVWCFGSNMAGQVNGIRSTDPVALTQMEDITDAVELGSSGYDMWALTPKGTWIWGNNTFRQAAPAEGGDGVGPTFIDSSASTAQSQ